MSTDGNQALKPYRVLDLTDEKGHLCGKIFADLGAEVIKIEPPEGDSARRKSPGSLFWMAYNTGKKSVTLDISKKEDEDKLLMLVKSADFLIESFSPGYLKSIGLEYSALEKINPGLIMASITPFGQTGPRANWKCPDLICWAMGGYMWMTGEPKRAPLRISHTPQAFLHASAIAAAGCLMALFYRKLTGLGQHVDVCAQQCPSWMLTNTYAYWDLQNIKLGRAGTYRQFGANNIKTVWRAKDGHITFMFSGGAIGAKGQKRVVELMDNDGIAEKWLKEINWDEMSAFSTPSDKLEDITEAFSKYFETKTKAKLLEEAIKSGIMLAPINNVGDVFDDPQLEARKFWAYIRDPDTQTIIKFPGEPVKMSLTPWQIKKCAPKLGENNYEILDRNINCNNSDLIFTEQLKSKTAKDLRPLNGIKVLDFSNTVLGPSTTRYLADHGAVVIRVESMAHPETLRIAGPFAKTEPHIDRSGYFAVHNAGKMSIALNMKRRRAYEVVKRLINWADVVIESFAPGVMQKFNLGYEEVKKIKPDIIMASTCLQGQTGPYSPHRGYGQMASAIAGWFELTGWPDGEPVGPYSAYSDFVDWNFLLASILSALDFRQRTGKGQYIDQSQLESALYFMIPALLDYGINKRIAGRVGNRDNDAAPHGAYKCKGEDRWCAIAVANDEEWVAFCKVVNEPWTKENRFKTISGRKENEDELDFLIEKWSMKYDADKLMNLLQKRGVPAGVVQNAEDLFSDPQLLHRKHFKLLDHPEMGQYHIATSAFKLSKCDNDPMSPAPLFGEHTEYVLKKFLGMSEEEITELTVDGVLE